MPEAATTGRLLVLLPPDDRSARVRALEERIGGELARTGDVPPEAFAGERFAEAGGIVLDRLGVAVIDAPDGGLSLSADVLAVEPERVVHALDGLSEDYLRGYRDAVVHLHGAAAAQADAPGYDESRLTWGLQATGVAESALTGAGVKVAVLDTGLDLAHPDFAGRSIVSESFVAGLGVQDVAGHGTHCIGTACGPREPGTLPRYGIAYEAEIHAGKVLDDQGRGVDADILAGIEWAVAAGCHVVSMSLGAPAQPGQAYSAVFERAARRALAAGTLIVAAAGNDSRRDQGRIAPVSHPANCPSILAVAALDPSLGVSFFSNGGQIDLAAPGRDVRSSWPMPAGYNTISGTSMATPHVAGIAALAAQADSANRGSTLWSALQRDATRLPQLSTDVGAGLARAV